MSQSDWVAGIDLGGSKISVSLWRGDKMFRVRHIEEKKGIRGDVLSEVCEKLFGTEHIFDMDYFFIEEPIVGRGVRASLQLSQMQGALLSQLSRFCRADRAHLVSVTTWKQHTVGHGNASKADVAAWLSTHHPDYYSRCDGNQDLVDATCIGLYGTRVVADSRSLELTGGAEQPDEPVPG